jgi:pyochelin biosynthetic protein PchC
MPPLADAVAAAVAAMIDRPAALFGHSLGAFIAYEVVCRIEAHRRSSLARLFVSGQAAPHRRRAGARHLWSDDRLWDELRRLGGTAPSLLDDATVRDVVLPTLRCDYRLSETYDPSASPPLRTPVSVLVSEADPEVTLDEAGAWCERTRADCRLHRFAGDHFYLVDHRPVLQALCRDLQVEWP